MGRDVFIDVPHIQFRFIVYFKYLIKFRYYNLLLLDAIIEKDPFKIDTCIFELKKDLNKVNNYHNTMCIYKRASINPNVISDLDTLQTDPSDENKDEKQERN